MMRFACPRCGQHIEADDDFAGQPVSCPYCQYSFTAPLASTLPPKAEPSNDISFRCARCGQHIAIDAAGAGLTVPCPKCGQNLVVPAPPKAVPVQNPASIPVAPPIITDVPPIIKN